MTRSQRRCAIAGVKLEVRCNLSHLQWLKKSFWSLWKGVWVRCEREPAIKVGLDPKKGITLLAGGGCGGEDQIPKGEECYENDQGE